MKLLWLKPQIQSDPTRGATTGGLDEAAQVESADSVADSVRPDQRCQLKEFDLSFILVFVVCAPVFNINNIWIVGGRSLNVNNIWVVGRGATTGGFDEAALVETADSARPDQRCDNRGAR
jgi:hypothetical protein